jgi:membrane protein
MKWTPWIIHRLAREWRYLSGAYERFTRDDGWLMSAAVAYYVGLSFFPLLIVLISAFGLFLRFTEQGQDAEAALLNLVARHLSTDLETNVAAALKLVQTEAAVNGPVALAGILMAALAGFVQFERAFDRIWEVPQDFSGGVLASIRDVVVRRGKAFLLLLASALVIVAIFITGLVLSGIRHYANEYLQAPDSIWGLAQTGISVGLNALMFMMLYRWLTKVPVRWNEALRGGLLVALLWEVGRQILTIVIVRSGYGSAYGVIGSFIAIQLWCYYAVAVVFFGAEYIQEFCRSCTDP